MGAATTAGTRIATIGAVLAALTITSGCDPAGSTDDPAPSPTPPAAAEPAGTSSPARPATRFADGDESVGRAQGTIVLVVGGVDVVPGVYRTVEAQVDDGKDAGILFDDSCKFGQYRDADGGLDSLIAGGTADGGHPTITLGDGHLFRTQRCGAWELVRAKTLFDAPDSAPTTVTDGMWLVGADLRPGTYRTDAEFSGEYVEGAFCGWEVDSGWTDWDAEILEVAFAGPGPGEVTLKTGQQFVSDECGTWRLLGQ